MAADHQGLAKDPALYVWQGRGGQAVRGTVGADWDSGPPGRHGPGRLSLKLSQAGFPQPQSEDHSPACWVDLLFPQEEGLSTNLFL